MGLEQPRGLERRLPLWAETPRYSNTNASPSANSTLTMMMETKPMLLKGWALWDREGLVQLASTATATHDSAGRFPLKFQLERECLDLTRMT